MMPLLTACQLRWRSCREGHRDLALPVLVLVLTPTVASAFTITITAGSPKEIYLQVGVGSFTGLMDSGGTPQNNSTINTASVSVPATAVGNGTTQTMTT